MDIVAAAATATGAVCNQMDCGRQNSVRAHVDNTMEKKAEVHEGNM